MSQARITKRQNERQTPPRNTSLGMHVTEVGERVLQTLCGEFDSHRLHFFAFVPQLGQDESCKFAFVSSTLTEGSIFMALSSNWLGSETFTLATRVRISLALINDLVTQWLEYAPFKRVVVGSNPTRVISRLIAQRTEQLPSKVNVLGSNPSKAGIQVSPLSPRSRPEHAPCYERGVNWFNSNRGFQTSVGAIGSADLLQR